jgi:hypothetical protein
MEIDEVSEPPNTGVVEQPIKGKETEQLGNGQETEQGEASEEEAGPLETIKYFNLKSVILHDVAYGRIGGVLIRLPLLSQSISRSTSHDDAHELEKRKHFNQLGSAAFVGGPTSPPSVG